MEHIHHRIKLTFNWHILTHFSTILHFNIPCKYQETSGFPKLGRVSSIELVFLCTLKKVLKNFQRIKFRWGTKLCHIQKFACNKNRRPSILILHKWTLQKFIAWSIISIATQFSATNFYLSHLINLFLSTFTVKIHYDIKRAWFGFCLNYRKFISKQCIIKYKKSHF